MRVQSRGQGDKTKKMRRADERRGEERWEVQSVRQERWEEEKGLRKLATREKNVSPLTTSRLTTETLLSCRQQCHKNCAFVRFFWLNRKASVAHMPEKNMDEGMAKCVFRHFKIGPWVNLSSQQTVLPLFSYTHALLHLFMFKTHQCCRSLSCQIGLRWGSVYRHCRTNTSSRFKTPVSVIGNLPHMIQDTAMEGTKMYQEIEGRSVSVS